MSPRLDVQRPSPTTALFTASNAPSRRSWSSKFAFGIELLLRVMGFLAMLLVNLAKARHFAINSPEGAWAVPPELWTLDFGVFICRIADRYTWPIVAMASAIVTYAVWRKGYTGWPYLCCDAAYGTKTNPVTSFANIARSLQRNLSWSYADWAFKLRLPRLCTGLAPLQGSYQLHKSKISSYMKLSRASRFGSTLQ